MAKVTHNNLRLRTWLEIDHKSLAHNYQVLRGLLSSDCQLMAVTKSNAYGHSLLDYSLAVQELGVDWIGVDSLVEALALRDHQITIPILVLGYTFPELVPTAIIKNISLLISSFTSLQELVDLHQANGLRLHLKFDTGMSRQGFLPCQADEVLHFINEKLPNIIIEGVCTHLAGAKNPAYPQSAQEQLAKFAEVLAIFAKHHIKAIRHVSATAGTLALPSAHYDLVRFGIGLYGLWPSVEIQQAWQDKLELKPILTWKTVVAEVKTLPAGSKVGYDWTEIVTRETIMAVLPVGYWHGYDRSLSSLGYAIIKEQRAKVLGRVCMDMIMVDVTDILGVEVGDEVVLLGQQGPASFSADEMAKLASTTNYEIITRLNPLIKRIYINN